MLLEGEENQEERIEGRSGGLVGSATSRQPVLRCDDGRCRGLLHLSTKLNTNVHEAWVTKPRQLNKQL